MKKIDHIASNSVNLLLKWSLLVLLFVAANSDTTWAQCGPSVPSFVIDLSASPSDSAIVSSTRSGLCCTASNPDRCIEFIVTLHPQATGLVFDIYSGAVPPGALYYQINCGPPVIAGEPICLNGPGPHVITFCKPGNNENEYIIRSVPGSIAGEGATLSLGCSEMLTAVGFESGQMTWTSIAPDTVGAYDYLLSCPTCDSTLVTADEFTPPFIDFTVCGTPLIVCDTSYACDTVRVYFINPLTINFSVTDTFVCAGQPLETITVIGGGGTPPYTYTWNTGDSTQSIDVGPGTYIIELFDSTACLPRRDTIVIGGNTDTITADAGPDLSYCVDDLPVVLNGSITGTTQSIWIGGSGTFTPSRDSLNVTYTPTDAEISAGGLNLQLMNVGSVPCPMDVDLMSIYIYEFTAEAAVNTNNVTCFGNNDGIAIVDITGGAPPFTYYWNGSLIPGGDSLTGLGPGTGSVNIVDANGCDSIYQYTITEPLLLTASCSVTNNVSCFAGANGTANTTVAGGTAPYSYLWSDGQTTVIASNLIAGTYTVTVTDNNGCTVTCDVTVTEPTLLTSTCSLNNNVSCNGGSDGSATVSASGGTVPYTYLWSDGQTDSTAINLSAGTYTVTVTDNNGCTVTCNVAITEPTILSSTCSLVNNVSCNGGADGSASVSAIGGTLPYSYLWSDGQTNSTAVSMPAGTYTVTVTDNNSCTVTCNVMVTEPTILSTSCSVLNNVSCNGGNDGRASVSAVGGTAPYTYLWSNGQTSATSNGLAASTYTVTITDNNGCTVTCAVTITEPTILTSSCALINNVSCYGGNDGSVSVTAGGATAPYTYLWSDGQSTSTASNMSAGLYTVTVTDNNGCTVTCDITITEPTVLTSSCSLINNVSCNAGNDGQASVSASGGTTPYSYIWSNGQTTATSNGLVAGTYTVTVTDNNGCTVTCAVTITEPTLLTSSCSVLNNVSCNGGNDGQATVSASGGTAPYTYIWSNGQTNTTSNGLTAGTYTVTVTDNNACTITCVVNVTEPTVLTATANVSNNVSCNSGADGTAGVTASGGTLPYTYLWSNGASTAGVTGLLSGVYTVTVTDNNGCTVTSSVTVTEPAVLTATCTVESNVSCTGGNDGRASVSVSGGTPPYAYVWTNGDTTYTADSLLALTYVVTVTDGMGCTTDCVVTIVQPPLLTASCNVDQNASCYGTSDASVSVTSGGGVGSYTYLWSTGDTTSTVSGLLAGTYTVTVSDSNACSISCNVTVTEPILLSATCSVLNNVSCNGGNDGQATVSASGGTAPYTYIWSNGQTNTTSNGLTAGTYTVTVTDNNACTITCVVNVTEPTVLTATANVSNNVSCNSGADGTAGVTASGGTLPYTYLWSNGASTAGVTGLLSGVYTVTVTDNNGCTVTSSVTVTEPAVLTATCTVESNVSCTGGNDGRASVSVTGGTPPYAYVWTNGDTTYTADSLLALTYVVTVTDGMGCTTDCAVTIVQPPLLTASCNVDQNASCYGTSDASVSVTSGGGVGSYTYLWSTGDTTSTVSGLLAGTYTVTVSDSNACSISCNVTVTEPILLSATCSVLNNVSCNGGNDGQAAVSASGGTAPYTYMWSNGQTSTTSNGLIAGSYTVTVTDNNACTITCVVNVTEPPVLTASANVSNNVSCNSGADGTAGVTANGGTIPYTYLWSNGASTTGVTGLLSGVYTVTVTDNNGCTATSSVTVTEPAVLTAVCNVESNVSCTGGNDGKASVSVTGGTPPYAYVWTSGDTTYTADSLLALTYVVTVTDGMGCTTDCAVTIVQPPLLTASCNVDQNASCYGTSDASVSVTSGGGVGSYSYLWSTGDTTATISGLLAGTYTVTVSDSNGCSISCNVIVTEPTILSASCTVLNNVSCNGGNDGRASVSAVGGTAPYTYLWSNGQTSTTSNGLSASTYTVTITDNNGCTVTCAVTITEPTILSSNCSVVSNVNCNGGSNGVATVLPSGGTAPYSYSWSDGQSTVVAINLSAGSYTVTVSDNNGCTVTCDITITEPTVLTSSCSLINNVSCNAGNDGQASVSASGGTVPYSYIWSNGQTNATSNGLVAGIYTVTVTDNNGCTVTCAVTITEPTLLTSSCSVLNNVSCNGGNDGQATVSASGGTTPYTYLWSNGQTNTTSNGLSAGTYTVTVTDNNACTVTCIVNITEPVILTASANVSNNVSCNSGADGTAGVSASGGTIPYTYLWSNGASSSVVTGLLSGVYTATVTDNNGCTATSSVTVTEPAVLTATCNVESNVSCAGGNDGKASVSVSGGTPPYAYVWTSGDTTFTADSLLALTYVVTVTDGMGCTTDCAVTIIQPPILTASCNVDQNASCYGTSDASVSVTSGGGVGSYTYLWSTGDTTAAVSGLLAGTYTVTVSDSNACSISCNVTVTEPILLSATCSVDNNVSCNGGSDGSASAIGSGGTAPYTYLWSNGQSSVSANGLSAGNYTVTVTDNNSCTVTCVVNVTEPTILTSTCSVDTNVSCNGGNDGSATAMGSGGTSPYTYLWSNGQSSSSANSLSAGNYTVTVTDNNACTVTCLVTITEPTVLTSTCAVDSNVSCFGGNDGSASVLGSGGTAPYTYLWSDGQTGSSALNLSAGGYIVTVTDNNACTVTCAVVVTQPTILTSSCAVSNNVSCNGGSDGTATVLGSGGTAPYTFLWSNGQTTSLANNLSAINYTVTVTDNNGCTVTCVVNVTEPTVLTSTCSVNNNVSCNGGSDGSASVIGSGGTAPYTYLWSNGQSSASANGLSAGNYTVTVTDNNSCTVTCVVNVTEPTILTSTCSVDTNVSCNGGNDGSASAMGSGGTAPYSYVWSNGQTNSTSNGLAAGIYTVTVTDAQGCTISCDVTITEPTILSSICSVVSNVNCNGGSNGVATVLASGGTAPYSYTWSDGQTTVVAINLTAGLYTATVTDNNGCTVTCDITITEPTVLTSSCSVSNNVSCNGGNDGTATVLGSGGTAPYTFLWSNGQTTSLANNLSAINYTVTVTDNNGCTVTCVVNVTEPTILTSTCSVDNNVSCNGGSDGSASAIGSGGTAPYSYLWSNGQSTSSANGLSAGNYTVTVTDNNGCTVTCVVNVTEPTILTSTCSVDTNVSCNGGNDGSASAMGSGGTAPYSYLWSNGQSSSSASSLSAGNYTVTVTDNNGCTVTCDITITEPTILTSTCAVDSNVSCFGENDAGASVIGSGGTAPYTYLWSDGQTGSSAINLSAGGYIVTVTDNNACTVTCAVVVTQPTVLTSSCAVSNNVSCNGGSDGTATVIGSGGTAPYTFLWSNGQTTSLANNLIAINYTVTVTDNNGCTVTCVVNVTEPTVLTSTCSVNNNVSCTGGSDGSASTVGSGGTVPYSYLWSNGQSTATANGLSAGNYTVTVTDNNSCTVTCVVIVTEPSVLTSVCAVDTNVSCTGGSDGYASVTVSGGTAPYSYLWSNGQTTSIASNLIASNYTVVATDSNGCTTTCSVTITEPSILIANCILNNNASCFGASDGAVSVSASGGTPPYSYLWSNGVSTASNSGLIAGTYTVSVTDANGCTVSCNSTITEPNDLVALCNLNNNVSCYGGNDGSIAVTASGGTAPYSYAWSNGSTSSIASSLFAGTYTVTVTDINGCSVSCDILLTEPSILKDTALVDRDVSCNGGSDGQAFVSATGGTAPYTFNWSNGQSGSVASGLSAGIYTVTVTDINACTASYEITITEPALLVTNCTLNNDVSCNGGDDGMVTVSPSGGVAPYSFLWSNGQDSSTAVNLSIGVYSVTVTDSLGCTSSCNISVGEPGPLVASCSVLNDVACYGGNDGVADVSASGGVAPYTYSWSNGNTNSIADSLSAGTYIVTVTDYNLCSTTCTLTVTEPPVFSVTPGIIENVSCFGGNNGTATIIPNGGVAPYSFNWSNGQTTANAINLVAGTYTVTIYDANSCTATDTIIISEPSLLSTSCTVISDVNCMGGDDGSAYTLATGGTLPYTYLWSNGQTTDTLNNLPAGTYTVSVSDANSCFVLCNVIISEPLQLNSICNVDSNVSCFGENDGKASVQVSGGTAPYSYLWSSGDTTVIASDLIAGTYTVTVTDANACSVNCTVIITQPALLIANCSLLNNVSCNGGTDGRAAVMGSGGTPPYSFVWSDGQTGSIASNLQVGSYVVSITDNNGCTASCAINIREPQSLVGSCSTIKDVSCFAGSDGIASINAVGGVAPYSYLWSNGQTTANAINLSAGSYTVTVTDFNLCTVTCDMTINEPALLAAQISVMQNVKCNGGSDGEVEVNVIGGITPYSYSWSTGHTISSISGLSAGIYTATVLDSNGCAVSEIVNVTEPFRLTTGVDKKDVLCNGDCIGEISLNANGGTSPYFYSWSNGLDSSFADQLCAGTYDIMVTDTNNCKDSLSVTISEPAPLLLTSSVTPVTCNGMNNGSINITVSGGAPIYSYQWSNGFTVEDLNSLGGGSYTVLIKDQNQCETTIKLMVDEPDPIELITTGDTLICDGASVEISAIATGGNGGTINYVWSDPGIIGSGPHVVSPSNNICWTVTASDSLGCTSPSDDICVDVMEPLSVSISASDSICPGDSITLIALTTGGNNNSYSMTWSTGAQNVSQITVLPTTFPDPAIYILNLEDQCSSSAVDSFIIGFHDIPLADGSIDDERGCVPHTVTLEGLSTGASNCYWDMGDGTQLSGCGTIIHEYTDPGSYEISLIAENSAGCRSEIAVISNVDVIENPYSMFGMNQDQAYLDDPLFNFYNYSGGGSTYHWDFGDGTTSDQFNPSHAYQDTGLYVVTLYVYNEDSCVDVYQSQLKVELDFHVFIPNAFTPNDDGVNEGYIPIWSGSMNKDTYIFQIWNRWGEKLFETNNPYESWKGLYNDAEVQQDVYIYRVFVVDMSRNRHVLSGNVTLLK